MGEQDHVDARVRLGELEGDALPPSGTSPPSGSSTISALLMPARICRKYFCRMKRLSVEIAPVTSR